MSVKYAVMCAIAALRFLEGKPISELATKREKWFNMAWVCVDDISVAFATFCRSTQSRTVDSTSATVSSTISLNFRRFIDPSSNIMTLSASMSLSFCVIIVVCIGRPDDVMGNCSRTWMNSWEFFSSWSLYEFDDSPSCSRMWSSLSSTSKYVVVAVGGDSFFLFIVWDSVVSAVSLTVSMHDVAFLNPHNKKMEGWVDSVLSSDLKLTIASCSEVTGRAYFWNRANANRPNCHFLRAFGSTAIHWRQS